MYRIPKDQLPCKYDHSWYEDVAGDGGSRMAMWDCLWFEQAPEDTKKAIDIAAEIDKPDFHCSPKCTGFEAVETAICKKHDVEYYEECPDCMQEQDAAQDAKE